MSALWPKGGWCWTADDPEATYPDPREWLDQVGYYLAEPLVQRFDWGIPAPSTWLVASYPEDGERPVIKEFASEAEAEAFAAEIKRAEQLARDGAE